MLLNIFLSIFTLILMGNPIRPGTASDQEGHFYKTKNGCQLFIYDYRPKGEYKSTIFVLSGITGINHIKENDVIQLLSHQQNRVVVIHPRGTGYSEGKRGDISYFPDFINDYVEIITQDPDYVSKRHKVVLFGHSMSTAFTLAVASKMDHVGGVILVNPPYILKRAKGMSPDFGQYLKYAFYYVFARHVPVVDMGGNPAKIENDEDRKDTEQKVNDPLLVKYFSLYYMIHSRKTMKAMLDFSRIADYPLLLIYGEKDSIVDKKGCDLLFDAWKSEHKKYLLIENGTHGKSTILLSRDLIRRWMEEL
jgi:pimeloyl-ACP methyl ester carboxylesterase